MTQRTTGKQSRNITNVEFKNPFTLEELRDSILLGRTQLKYGRIQELARLPNDQLTDRDIEMMYHFVFEKTKNTTYYEDQIFEVSNTKQISFEKHVKYLKYKKKINM